MIRRLLLNEVRYQQKPLDDVARLSARGLGLDLAQVMPVVDELLEEAARNKILDTPPGVSSEDAESEARLSNWYVGPQDGDVYWGHFCEQMTARGMGSILEGIDQESTKVVAHLASPYVQKLKKRGLVVGYVQAGKTANYTAVMAKAADAGYRLVVVLSGLHNNLRRQTQVRLTSDLGADLWYPLTSDEADFGGAENPAALLKKGGSPTLLVVKKNQSRLRNVIRWLKKAPVDQRRRTPILLIDDEADQATPNSAVGAEHRTRINQLVRELWSEIHHGTYVGYTATPFANVFMDPDDEKELYPADFIIDLPRQDNYFGAERVFGREPLDDADDPDPGLDMVRSIPDHHAGALRPPSATDARFAFDPELPGSLVDAVVWFLVATAIRRARGQRRAHSSMLVHTTHYVQPHFAMQKRISDLLLELRQAIMAGDLSTFLRTFESEANRVAVEATVPLPMWSQVASELPEVLEATRVVVDNGESDDRLDYDRELTGVPAVETVIAIGGGTLSRGLTLEGLVVSYFTRTSNTYDTLLQMGRWFGYRSGYEDLPRIWMQSDLADDYRFLSLVEEEIRQDMRYLERQRITPQELGIKVRAHPGRLAIVAKNKMQHADTVRITYSGNRLQTFIFGEDNRDTPETGMGVLDHNLEVTRRFLARAAGGRPVAQVDGKPRWKLESVSPDQVVDLIDDYWFHPDQATMHKEAMIGWIRRAAPGRAWNVVIVGSSAQPKTKDGQPIDLGRVDLGSGVVVPAVNRAPLPDPGEKSGTANIKALMSHSDWFLDIEQERPAGSNQTNGSEPREVRRLLAEGRGLVVVYPISRYSVPMGAASRVGSRRPMNAEQHLIGLGLIFPDVDGVGIALDATYYSVRPDWEVSASDDIDEIPEDAEASTSDPDGEDDYQ